MVRNVKELMDRPDNATHQVELKAELPHSQSLYQVLLTCSNNFCL